MLQTRNLSIAGYGPSGAPRGKLWVTATLTIADHDIDGGTVLPEPVTEQLADNGFGVLGIWPNERGTQGSRYQIQIYDDERTYFDRAIYMPDADSSLGQLVEEQPQTDDSKTAAAISAAAAKLWATYTPGEPVPAPPGDGELESALSYAIAAGQARDAILMDPGFIAVAADLVGADAIGAVAAITLQVQALAPLTEQIQALAVVDAEIAALAPHAAAIGELAPKADDIAAVALIGAQVTAVADAAGSVTVVADSIGAVATVSEYMAAVLTAAGNIQAIIGAPSAASAAASSADLSEAWATGAEPGGPGTLSAREEADRAEDAATASEAATVRPDLLGTLLYAIDQAGQANRQIPSLQQQVDGALADVDDAIDGFQAQLDEELAAPALDIAALLGAVAHLASVAGQSAEQLAGGTARFRGGSLADPALRIGTIGIYSSAADTLSVAVAGSEVLRVTPAGITVYGTVTEVA